MFSPEQKSQIIHKAAELVVDEILQQMEHNMQSLHMVPVTIASKLMGVETRTVKKLLPVIEITPRNHCVSMQEISKFIAARTTRPKTKRRTTSLVCK